MFLRYDIDYQLAVLSCQRIGSHSRRWTSLIGRSFQKWGHDLAKLALVPIRPTRWFVTSPVTAVNGPVTADKICRVNRASLLICGHSFRTQNKAAFSYGPMQLKIAKQSVLLLEKPSKKAIILWKLSLSNFFSLLRFNLWLFAMTMQKYQQEIQ